MTVFEQKAALQGLCILVDTREQNTYALRARLAQAGCPFERTALPFGDYSAKFPLPNGEWLDLRERVAIERKMDFTELAACYGKGRRRFSREFDRAREKGAKLYLLVESATWECAYEGQYRSRMAPSALVASLLAWLARYNCQVLMCKPQTTGRLMRDILYREGKEILEREGEQA